MNRKHTINIVSSYLQGNRFVAAVPFLSEEIARIDGNTAGGQHSQIVSFTDCGVCCDLFGQGFMTAAFIASFSGAQYWFLFWVIWMQSISTCSPYPFAVHFHLQSILTCSPYPLAVHTHLQSTSTRSPYPFACVLVLSVGSVVRFLWWWPSSCTGVPGSWVYCCLSFVVEAVEISWNCLSLACSFVLGAYCVC